MHEQLQPAAGRTGNDHGHGHGSELHPAMRKLQRLAHWLRVASAGYAAWVLWNILNWWLDADKVARNFGSFINRDLSALQPLQRYAAMGLDLLAWWLLLLAVVQCWKFLRCVAHTTPWNAAAAQHLSRCAWWAIACEATSLLLRPVKSFLLTSHLSAAEQVWRWDLRSQDLQGVLFCLSLLMFAYVFSWTMELAEENRSFV